jgi:hypothetical protein
LAAFYCAQLGCTLLAPERDLHGPLIDGALGVSDARINGVHVRLPGYGDDLPTIEIYRYEPLIEAGAAWYGAPALGTSPFKSTISLRCVMRLWRRVVRLRVMW